VTSATVDGRAAHDPASYLDLFRVGTKATTYADSTTWTEIALGSAPRSPWTDGNVVILYPRQNLLVRDGQSVSIPAAPAERIVAAGSLSPGGSFPWTALVAGLAAIALVLGAVAAFRPAAWRRPATQP